MNLTELRNHAMRFDRAVEKKPLYFDNSKEIKGWKAIYNMDKKKVATLTSDRYNLVQHSKVVQSVVDAVMNLNINADARVRDGGNRVFVDLTFKDHKIPIKVGEEFMAGIRIINSYDKTTGIIVAPRYLRMVCSNGMVVNRIISGYAVKHSKKMTKDFESTVARLLKKMIEQEETLRNLVEDCIADSIEWELMERILVSLANSKKHIDKIRELLPENPTRWSLYNAFTEYATHDAQLRPNVEQMLQGKAQKILVTPLVELVPAVKEKSK